MEMDWNMVSSIDSFLTFTICPVPGTGYKPYVKNGRRVKNTCRPFHHIELVVISAVLAGILAGISAAVLVRVLAVILAGVSAGILAVVLVGILAVISCVVVHIIAVS